MAEVLAFNSCLSLMRRVSESLELQGGVLPPLSEATRLIGTELELDRCCILLLKEEQNPGPVRDLAIAAEYSKSTSPAVNLHYEIAENGELFSLLRSGKPLPLKDLISNVNLGSTRQFHNFAKDTDSRTLVSFPLMFRRRLIGCLSMHYADANETFSDEVLELGEVLADCIATKYGARVCQSATENTDTGKRSPGINRDQSIGGQPAPENMINSLSKQLSWERWVRQIICKLHATLDRDLLLQSVVDGFGRSLSASRCLVVRTDGLANPMVTHEYVEPEISPLGLGRSGPFPLAAILPFRHKVGALPDLSALRTSGELSEEEYEYFSENGVRSMAGAPIASHGAYYGVIVILERELARRWSPHELDMLELVATQTAVALGHCQAYLQLKDQLFNMNLLGNLTQQLTSTLELVGRTGGKSDFQEERAKQQASAPPLSLRELEVLKLIASGLANREIAQRLFLTESTVELHASRIRKKLKLKSRTALVKYACDNGLA